MAKLSIMALVGALALVLGLDDASAHVWSPQQLSDLEAAAAAAPAEGLPPETEPLSELTRLHNARARGANVSAAIDETADALFNHLALTYAQGGVDPVYADPTWMLQRSSPADITMLTGALDGGAAPSVLLQGLVPASSEYRALRSELARVVAQSDEDGADGQQRADQIMRLRASLERLRWLPRQFPARRIEVRINQYQVMLYRETAPPMALAAIVGAARTQTPSFQTDLRAITLNPSWEPPRSIINELLPQFRRDPGKATREGYEVLDASGAVIDPSLVDWAARRFPYRLRQRPGPGNALGQVRFDLPNPFAIYIHDTPNRTLFARANRALSHGCIRVENPAELAAAVIGDPNWTVDALRAAIAAGDTQVIHLSSPMPIYVLYVTATAADDGSVVYFDDIYHRDAALVRALDSPQVSLVARTRHNERPQEVCRPF